MVNPLDFGSGNEGSSPSAATMGRSRHQRHGTYPRNAKHIPYGSERCSRGWGGETYSPKYGVWCDFVVNKKGERQKAKRLIKIDMPL